MIQGKPKVGATRPIRIRDWERVCCPIVVSNLPLRSWDGYYWIFQFEFFVTTHSHLRYETEPQRSAPRICVSLFPSLARRPNDDWANCHSQQLVFSTSTGKVGVITAIGYGMLLAYDNKISRQKFPYKQYRMRAVDGGMTVCKFPLTSSPVSLYLQWTAKYPRAALKVLRLRWLTLCVCGVVCVVYLHSVQFDSQSVLLLLAAGDSREREVTPKQLTCDLKPVLWAWYHLL